VETQSEKSKSMYGTGSLSEAVALIAAGPKARLLAARAISPDTMATCAIAESAT
jgi:cobalt-precorrin 5A hydrolase